MAPPVAGGAIGVAGVAGGRHSSTGPGDLPSTTDILLGTYLFFLRVYETVAVFPIAFTGSATF